MIEIYVTKVFAVIFEEFGVMEEPWQGEHKTINVFWWYVDSKVSCRALI